MPIRFALNHIAAPRRSIAGFFALARELGVTEVEIRNDLDGVPLRDGAPAASVREAATAAGVAVLSINALQRFNLWDAARAAEAQHLATYAAACGAAALVLCPVNDAADRRSPAQRLGDLREALHALRPILAAHGVLGLIEPLGFPKSSLRHKRDAIEAIDAVDAAGVFRVLHDTFHHYVAGEAEMFATRTGLVHISGVEPGEPGPDGWRDADRVLVGRADVVDNASQIAQLRREGYVGPFSFEPFAAVVHNLDDIGAALRASMAVLADAVAAPA